jgi:hypothetical protein
VTQENDIQRLHEQAVSVAPPVAINQCVGCWGVHADNCYPFVIHKRAESGSKVWLKGNFGEFDTLDEALEVPQARLYGSSTICSECSKLPLVRKE